MKQTTPEEKMDSTLGGELVLPETPSIKWLARVLTLEQQQLIKRTVAPSATDDELALFFWRAKRSGLDPFKRQIHFIKRRRRVQDNEDWKWEIYPSIETGIEGYRLIAARTGQLDGIKRGAIFDEKGHLRGGWAEVYRKDWKYPARAEVDLLEYCPQNDKGMPTGLWKTKPRMMIEKVAESTALRMAFPEDLSDLYTHEEMENAEHILAAPGYPDPLPSPPTNVRWTTETESEVVDTAVVVDEDPRPALVEQILLVRGRFKTAPSEPNWKKVCQAKAGTADLPAADAAALQDFLKWLENLQRGDSAMITELQKILKTP